MIIVKLQGGLGNQMFQYAAAKSLGRNLPIYFDLSFLKKNNISIAGFTSRTYQLSFFPKIKVLLLPKLLSRIIASETKFYFLLRKTFFPNISFINNIEPAEFNSISLRKTLYLDGYFQKAEIFNSYRKELLNEFTFPTLKNGDLSLLHSIKNTPNSVSIHLRRGDYLKPDVIDHHGVLPILYYKSAIEVIESKFSEVKYFVFSDDFDISKEMFSFLGDKAKIVKTGNSDWEDMYLMSKCKHHIIANSTFSWWSAWLNTYREKVVIAPKQWFADQNLNRTSEIIPKDWIEL